LPGTRRNDGLDRATSNNTEEKTMPYRNAIGALALASAMVTALAGAQAHDEKKYPDFSGQWKRPPGIANQYDISKPTRLGQVPPLTREYQLRWEAGLQDQNEGGQGTDPTFSCIPDGMPRVMNVIFPMELVVTDKTTYMLEEYLTQMRRIFTDGRDFPKEDEFEPSFMGYSIGKWIDEDNNGTYDVLEVETRLLKNPRSYDPSGVPFHDDGKTVVKERIYIDKNNKDMLHDDITTYDNALTQPWVVNKRFVREKGTVVWVEASCPEGNPYIRIEDEIYMRSSEGKLLPAKKGQRPPDLSHFTTNKAEK
jgi:hypothetical protein